MSWVVTIVFIVIILLIVFKHWDKVQPIISSLTKKKEHPIEIKRGDFDAFKQQRTVDLTNRRAYLRTKRERKTYHIDKELKQIDMQLALIRGGK